MRILLTNDDGPSSPFLQPFVDELSAWNREGDLQVVVPSEEQSWIGQSVTRFRPLYSFKRNFGNVPGYLVSGSPADCVGLGLGELYEERADLVVSGINIGTNAGLPFYLNSGTVGGARQAMLLGVFSLAFSVRAPEVIFAAWREENKEVLAQHESCWRRLAKIARNILAGLNSVSSRRIFDMLLVDIPWEATQNTDVKLTRLERRVYRPLYQKRVDGAYVHHFAGFESETATEETSDQDPILGDITGVSAGDICVTPVYYDMSIRDLEKLEILREAISALKI